MDEPEAGLSVDLPNKQDELLELLQDTIRTFRDHYVARIQNDTQNDKQKAEAQGGLKSELWQLDFYLESYLDQGVPSSQKLYIAADQVAEAFDRVLYADRIQNILERDIENRNSPNVGTVKLQQA